MLVVVSCVAKKYSNSEKRLSLKMKKEIRSLLSKESRFLDYETKIYLDSIRLGSGSDCIYYVFFKSKKSNEKMTIPILLLDDNFLLNLSYEEGRLIKGKNREEFLKKADAFFIQMDIIEEVILVEMKSLFFKGSIKEPFFKVNWRTE
jgi:hypothetical protein